MSYSFDMIVSLMRQRRTQDGLLIQGMIENRDRYNGEVVTILPDVSGLPAANRPGPNFFQEGIDGVARLANAAMPKIFCPVDHPDAEKAKALSDRRTGALYGAWHKSQLDLKLDRAYRHLAGYGTMALVVMPNDREQRADIQLRDPLTAYPELRAPDDIRPPANCGFLFARSAHWIRTNYPNAVDWIKNAERSGWDTLWDVVEWIDEEDVVIGVMGPRFPAYQVPDARPYGQNAVELKRWTNQAGMVPVMVPRRATLDSIMGQMTSMINYSDLYSRMLELQLVATEKNIFPDMVVMSRNGSVPVLVGGKWQDGRTGNVNMLIDGVVETISKESGPGTMPMLQLIDSHIRGTSGASGLFGGQNGGMRTGAGVDALGDFSANPLAAEAQRIMSRVLMGANEGIMAVEKGYYGDKKFTCILGLPGSSKSVTYVPNRDFKETDNVVAYVAPGADINKFAVAISQLVATGLMSRKTGRLKHPMIDNDDEEDQYVAIEKANDAALGGLSQEIATGTTSVVEAARFAQLVSEGMPIFKALLQAKSESATQAQAPGAAGGPPATGPDGQPIPPGLAQMLAAQGGGPSQAPSNPIPGPAPGSQNLRHIIQGINEQVSPGAT